MTSEMKPAIAVTNAQAEPHLPANPKQLESADKRRRSRWIILRDVLYDSWYGEVAAIIFSLACFCAIAIVLRVYDRKPIPSLPRGVTLNAIISVLATGSKSALLFSVASNISQWKWIWYRQQKLRKLADLQVFEDASRGPLGAAQLLFDTTRTSLGLIGASIVLLALAYDPFVQQLLTYPVQEVYTPSNFTWTRQAQIYPATGPPGGADSGLQQSLSLSLQSALWSNSTTPYQRTPVCASTNCTWTVFPSLGFCSKCADDSSTATVSNCSLTVDSFKNPPNGSWPGDIGPDANKTCHVDFASGLKAPIQLSLEEQITETAEWRVFAPAYIVSDLWHYDPVIMGPEENTFSGDYDTVYAPNKTILGIRDPLMVVADTTFKVKNSKMEVAQATMCTFDLCLREYDMSVANGVASISTSKITYGTKFNISFAYHGGSVVPAQLASDGYSCWAGGKDPAQVAELDVLSLVNASSGLATEKGRKEFVFCYDAFMGGGLQSLPTVLSPYITGNGTTYESVCGNECMEGPGPASPLTDGVMIPDIDSSDATARVHSMGLATFMENVAESLTKLVLDLDGNKIIGNSGSQVAFVHVRWLWLIMPGILELTGLVLLVLTIQSSKKRDAPLWKSSIFPLLFHGLESGSGVADEKIGRMQDVAEIMKKFEETHPHLLKGDFLTQSVHPDGAQTAEIMPSGRTNLRFKSCETPYRPKFICLKPQCRRLFKPFFDPDHFEYRIDRYEWSFRPRPDVDPAVKAAKWMSGSRFSEDDRRKIRELGERCYHFRQGHAVEPLSEEDIAWLKERDPEAWWTPLIRIGDDHQKRCPSCAGKGVRVGSNFQVPGRKNTKAWKEFEKMVDEGVDMQAEFEFCPSNEMWEEMAKEAERVRSKGR
ncbi:hypothetical protein H2200_000962 [Cladophialophora chaetospira]|uniref:Uncharacterized protein n=1 Tax=Cladophialophora chaetospira TaxID=386627 RepID=A0AA38XQC8_9EURO|nr:hypothetical protein H2200_000962 [Cladophialophora chaetospira]